jgi:hypothetical protein
VFSSGCRPSWGLNHLNPCVHFDYCVCYFFLLNLFWCLCYNKLVSEPRFIWLEIICQGTSTVHRRCCLEAIDRVSFIGGEHDSTEYCCGKHCSPEHCLSAQLLFIYSTVHGRRILFIKALFTKSIVHRVLFMSAVYVALFKDGVHSIVHERSAGYCPRKEYRALFKDRVQGTVQGRSTEHCSKMECRVLSKE